jgi:hypothetical protein
MTRSRFCCTFAAWIACATSAQAAPLFTERVSVNPTTGALADAPSLEAAISGDGCVVAFKSTATNLVDPSFGITQGTAPQVYAVNRCVVPHTIDLVSVDTTGTAPANGTCAYPNVSADGRYVAFWSNASNLPGGANNASIFIRDRTLQTTSSPLAAWQATALIYNDASKPYMSADGRYLALDFLDTGIAHNLYLFDVSGAKVTMQPICPQAAMSASTPCQNAVISADGTAVVFDTSYALVAADTNGFDDDYIYSVTDASYRLVSVNADGSQGNDNVDGNGDAVPSADASVVAFYSYLPSTLGGAGNSLLRKDLASGALATLNLDWQGQIVGINPPNPSISDDASRIGFTALSTRPLVQHPNEFQTDSLIFDTSSNGLASVCRSSTAAWGDALCENVKLSGSGQWATFDSYASNLDSDGANGVPHIFVTDVDAVLDLIFLDAFEP